MLSAETLDTVTSLRCIYILVRYLFNDDCYVINTKLKDLIF